MLSLVVIDAVRVATTEEAAAAEAEFDRFARETGRRLRIALVARYGVEAGVDAAADALAYAWEHWDRVGAMTNPAGYLFRVGQTSARRQRRWSRRVDLPAERGHQPTDADADTDTDTDLSAALARLDDRQRTAVVLAHVYDWSYAEIGGLLGVPVSTVRNLVHRGMTKLRRLVEA